MVRSTRAVSASVLVAGLLAAILLALFGVMTPAAASGAPSIQQSDVTSPSGDGDDDDDDGNKIYGIIESMPASGLIGQWLIGGKVYTTTPQTEFDQEEGELKVGACAKVQLVMGSTTQVRELDSEPAGDCNNGGGDDDDDGREVYGRVDQLPANGLIGTWIVSGKSYTVTAQTEIKQKYGPIKVNGCVKLHLLADGKTVREAETDRRSRCNGGSDDDDDNGGGNWIGKGELYATLNSFPEGFIGVWTIGNISFTVDANTELQTKNGPFVVNALVKVEFVILPDGTFLAREIKTAYTPDADDDDDDDDDDDNGYGHGHNEAKAFGLIEVLPSGGLVGIWQIGGISYTVTISTEFHNDAANFAVGKRVKVEYKTDNAGSRTAREIKIAGPGGDQGNDDKKLVGYVDAVPADGLIGEWMIAGVPFSTTADTKFNESNGLLVAGAFVKVEYKLVNNVRVALEIEAKVPPGAGDHTHVGKVEKLDDSNVASAAPGATVTWVVGGRSFVVDEATKVDSALDTSSTAAVNSYTAADGSQVATRISTVTLGNFLFMPAARK